MSAEYRTDSTGALIRGCSDDVPRPDPPPTKRQQERAALFGDIPWVYQTTHDRLLRKLNRLRENDAVALHLREELLRYRLLAEEAEEDYGKAMELAAAVLASEDTSQEAKHAAIGMMKSAGTEWREMLRDVRECCVDAARVEFMADDRYSGRAVREILLSAVRMLRDVCGVENEHIAEEFSKKIMQTAHVRATIEGTVITPDADREVLDMDHTIPSVHGGSNGNGAMRVSA